MMLRNFFFLNVLLITLLLNGCNGSSGANGDDPFNPDAVPSEPAQDYTISLTILEQDCLTTSDSSFENDEIACVQATLLLNGEPANDEIIGFSSNIGLLSVSTKLTNESGIAQISLSSDNSIAGAGSITASFQEVSTTSNLEFLLSASQAFPTQLNTIELTLNDTQGNATNRFSNNESANISVSYRDGQGNPIANKVVNFQSTIGELSVATALTNNEGIANAQLNSQSQIGAGTLSANVDEGDIIISNALNFEVFEQLPETQDIRIGHFNEGVFVENVLGIINADETENVTISAGATLGVFVDLVNSNDSLITNSLVVSFASSCVEQSNATINSTITSISGKASATYQDISCATGMGNQDTLQASIVIDGNQLTATRTIEILPEDAGSIRFLSAAPQNLVLQGTGGQNSDSISLLTFEVTGAQGNLLSQQEVSFSLNTETGDLSLSQEEGITNSQGQVSTRVIAGNVPTSVRVTASLTTESGQIISTQSDLLSVNTGLPDQNSFSLSASDLNPEANEIDGQTVVVTARLADTFNNPVPDGTSVSFTTEGGTIDASCTTLNGVCSVNWTSSQPRATDHRVTILATAIGHETLIDANGNNVYDNQDGAAIRTDDGSGFDITLSSISGFVDLSEAWRDDNENRRRDSNEIFLDFNSSGSFDGQNGLFDGPQCESSNCGATSLHVRRALTLVNSSSSARISVRSGTTEIANNQSNSSSNSVLNIPRGNTAEFILSYSDTAQQPIASGSSIQIESSAGLLGGIISDIMPLTNANGARSSTFTLSNDLASDDDPIDSVINITIISPSGVQSNLNLIVTLE